MKKKNLKMLKLNKKSISNLDNTLGGTVPPPPPTLVNTCVGPAGHAICAGTINCPTQYWCTPSNHPTCFESQNLYDCFLSLKDNCNIFI